MSHGESTQVTGLRAQYQTYEQQKCFIAYTELAPWSADLLSACEEVLLRPEFNLEPDTARKHFDPEIPLRQKALELIANARFGIYDLSYWQKDRSTEWHMPRNVFIELGMAIGLNRPTMLLRRVENRGLELPECLKSLSGHILEFSGKTTLTRALEECLPPWILAAPDQAWWMRDCIFGGRRCEYREAHPRARVWGQQSLPCHIADGPDLDRNDFRAVIEDVLERFSDLTYYYLDSLPLTAGYTFLLCSYCQAVRSTPFAIYRISPYSPPETFIAIGLSIALEAQFDYKIPKILLTENLEYVPSLLAGYDVIIAQNDRDRKARLRALMPAIVHKVRETAWRPRPLPFFEGIHPGEIVPETSPEFTQPTLVSSMAVEDAILIVDDIEEWVDILTRQVSHVLAEIGEHSRLYSARSLPEAEALLAEHEFRLILTGIRLEDNNPRDRSGLELIRKVRQRGQSSAIVVVTASADRATMTEAFRDLHVVDFLDKSTFDDQKLRDSLLRALSLTQADTQNPLQVLREKLRALEPSGDPDTALKEILNTAVALTGADEGAVLFLGDDQAEIIVRAATDVSVVGIRLPLGVGISGLAFQRKMPILVDDVLPRPANEIYKPLNSETATRSELVVPIIANEQALGVINVESRRIAAFDQKTMDLLTQLTAEVSPLLITIYERTNSAGVRAFKRIANPFVYGPSIQESALFFDREQELTRVLQYIDQGQHTSIVGPRRIGKTSLLRAIQQQVANRENRICIFVDMSAIQSEDAFFSRLNLVPQGTSGPDSQNSSTKEVVRFNLQIQLEEIRQRNQRIVVLIDEFEVTAQFSEGFFGTLRAWGDSNVITMVVTSASELHEITGGSSLASPLYNIFTAVRLGPFDRLTTRELITQHGTLHWSDAEIDFVFDTTRGYPFFVQMLGGLLIEQKNQNLGQANLQIVRDEFLERTKQYHDLLDSFTT
jgi:CheY-like chemotaxis protein